MVWRPGHLDGNNAMSPSRGPSRASTSWGASQVFVWIGALKITAGSAGAALAGAMVVPMTHLPLLLASALIAVTVGASLFDRRRERSQSTGSVWSRARH